jgi:hypothetical protein
VSFDFRAGKNKKISDAVSERVECMFTGVDSLADKL